MRRRSRSRMLVALLSLLPAAGALRCFTDIEATKVIGLQPGFLLPGLNTPICTNYISLDSFHTKSQTNLENNQYLIAKAAETEAEAWLNFTTFPKSRRHETR